MKKTITLFLLVAFTIISRGSFAQGIRGSISLGGSTYLGDLIEGASVLNQVSPAVSLGISSDISQQFRARLNFSILGAKGDDKLNTRVDYKERNLNFKTSIWELALLGEFDFLNAEEHAIVPYIFGGPGIYHFNPTTIDRNGIKVNLHDIGTEGQFLGNPDYADRQYNLTQLNLQLGAGARYRLSETVSVGVDLSFRKLFTDYLDDVSTLRYPATSEFLSAGQVQAAELSFRGDEIGHVNNDVKGFPRGNPDKKDLYYTLQVRAIFLLNNSYYNR